VHDDERVPWEAVFGDARPVEVEIGPGRGDVLYAAAAAAPERNFFAIEHLLRAAESLQRGAVRRGLGNVRVLGADARCVIARLVPDASVSAYHIYFPDPWPKRRHHRRRLVSPDFAPHLRRTLVPGGTLTLATDLPDLLKAYARALTGAGFLRLAGGPPPARPTTHFERRYATGGTHHARFVRPQADGRR
jgi:tRNA (guanine-N7-)-methyltransferase